VWKSVFFFLPRLDASDSIFLTLVLFSLINLFVCMRKGAQAKRLRDMAAVGVASVILAAIFLGRLERQLHW
jgi:hypothetical protein